MNLRTYFSNGFSTNETADLMCVCYKLGLATCACPNTLHPEDERYEKTEGFCSPG